MAGYISYPRTESSGYPKGFDFDEPLREQARQPDWGEHVASREFQPAAIITNHIR